MNVRRPAAALCAAVLATITAANGSDLSQEYDQVKKIALKDPKVRAAFEKANAELDKRIVEIDPSLKPFVEKHRGMKKQAAREKRAAIKTIHVVTKGETLTSIARHYHVSVDSLLRANHVSKQGTLQVGQRLVIPTDG